MPFYEYQCQACSAQVEVLQKINDAPLKKCPECGKLRLKKLVSAPVFRLKGGGWYETDFKSDGEKKRNLVETEKAEDKAESKPADKPADKAVDKPEGKPADKPAEKSTEKPADKTAAKPIAGRSSASKSRPVRKTVAKPASRAARKGKHK
jgi:putative FmdB family regulatory protein